MHLTTWLRPNLKAVVDQAEEEAERVVKKPAKLSRYAASLKEGVLHFFLAVTFIFVQSNVRHCCHHHTAARTNADEESRFAPNEMMKIEVQQDITTYWHVLGEKLTVLSSSMEVVHGKMLSYAAPLDATKEGGEESLIKL
ncbi:hypothetical protein GYMLUDRAFT_245955 [Collybiopsis luxurians FD-317 M1]|uniref:Uncharacterized protein n=1 Tax=Collybiopsis luxurians FD-317 M1 TaxID=944289 RepID=A0A0D0CJJ7_9AGAR|nr:hypothetical protein GYMLUDRAFT_245955 [Collybiopsis luxurians FD-317 M1]